MVRVLRHPHRASQGVKQMSLRTKPRKEFGEHSVVRETARDETGTPYHYYVCVDCGKEHVDERSFTDEAVDAHRCNGGDA